MNRFLEITSNKNEQLSFDNYADLKKWLIAEIQLNFSFYNKQNLMFFLPKTKTAAPKITGGITFDNKNDYIEYFKKMPADTCFVGIVESENKKVVFGINCPYFLTKIEVLNNGESANLISFKDKEKSNIEPLSIEQSLKIIEKGLNNDTEKEKNDYRKWA